MHRFILKIFILFCLLLSIAPRAACPKENNEVIHLKKQVIVHIKYGGRDGEFGRKEQGGFITAPKAFAFDSKKNIYIADNVNEIPRIQIFNEQGKFLRKINLKSERDHPYVTDIVIHNNNLYVLMDKNKIQILSLMGHHIRTINFMMKFDVKQQWTDALYNPERLEVDNKENIYLSTRFGALVKLDPQGVILQKWSPYDHYLDYDGNLFIMNFYEKSSNGKVAKYSIDDKKITEGTCDDLFATTSTRNCKLPSFIDKRGRMYRVFSNSFIDNVQIIRFTKQQSTQLGVNLYWDKDGYYYKVDDDGNIYTIKDDLIKYSTSE